MREFFIFMGDAEWKAQNGLINEYVTANADLGSFNYSPMLNCDVLKLPIMEEVLMREQKQLFLIHFSGQCSPNLQL